MLLYIAYIIGTCNPPPFHIVFSVAIGNNFVNIFLFCDKTDSIVHVISS